MKRKTPGTKDNEKSSLYFRKVAEKQPEAQHGVVAPEIEVTEKSLNVWTNQRGQKSMNKLPQIISLDLILIQSLGSLTLNAMVLEWQQD